MDLDPRGPCSLDRPVLASHAGLRGRRDLGIRKERRPSSYGQHRLLLHHRGRLLQSRSDVRLLELDHARRRLGLHRLLVSFVRC
jgi:hypothetical protein